MGKSETYLDIDRPEFPQVGQLWGISVFHLPRNRSADKSHAKFISGKYVPTIVR